MKKFILFLFTSIIVMGVAAFGDYDKSPPPEKFKIEITTVSAYDAVEIQSIMPNAYMRETSQLANPLEDFEIKYELFAELRHINYATLHSRWYSSKNNYNIPLKENTTSEYSTPHINLVPTARSGLRC